MKIETINIINGRVLGWDSLTFETRSDYEDCINGMIDYVADKELKVEFDHQAFSTNETDCTDSISMFCSVTFKSIIMDNCIAWKEGEIITINLLERTPTNIGCSKVARNKSHSETIHKHFKVKSYAYIQFKQVHQVSQREI